MIKSPGTGGLSTGAGSSVVLPYTDNSGTPGATTINTPSGRAAIATGAASCAVTSSIVTATSKVLVNLEGTDATLTTLLHTIPGSGSFTVTGNANATGNTKFSFVVFN